MPNIVRRVHHRDHFKVMCQARAEFFADTLRPWMWARSDVNTHPEAPGFKDRGLEPRVDTPCAGLHDAAEARENSQSIRCVEDPISEGGSYLRCIPANELTDRFEIVGGLRRPPYFSHFAIRWRISSWLISSPRSA